MSTHEIFRRWHVAVGFALLGAMAMGGRVRGVPESTADPTPRVEGRLASEAGGAVSGVQPEVEFLIVPVMPPAGEAPYPPGTTIVDQELILPAGAEKAWFDIQLRRLASPAAAVAAIVEDDRGTGTVASATCGPIEDCPSAEFPSGKCCIPTAGCCDAYCEDQCTQLGGVHTYGVYCTNKNDPCIDCAGTPGKCCTIDHQCSEVQCEAECAQIQGDYTSGGSCTGDSCADCPQIGYCCDYDNGSCGPASCAAQCNSVDNYFCCDVPCSQEQCVSCPDGCGSATTTRSRVSPLPICTPATCVMTAFINPGRPQFLPGGQAFNLVDVAGPYFVIEYPFSETGTPITSSTSYFASVLLDLASGGSAARGGLGQTATGGGPGFSVELDLDPAESFLKDPSGRDIPFQTSPGTLTVLAGGSIPAVSTWGLVGITLALLVGAKIYFGRRRSAAR